MDRLEVNEMKNAGEKNKIFFTNCFQAQHLDIIGFNRYIGWYSNTGQLYEIKKKIITEAQNWHRKHNKPVYMTEYGADSVGGIHTVRA